MGDFAEDAVLVRIEQLSKQEVFVIVEYYNQYMSMVFVSVLYFSLKLFWRSSQLSIQFNESGNHVDNSLKQRICN